MSVDKNIEFPKHLLDFYGTLAKGEEELVDYMRDREKALANYTYQHGGNKAHLKRIEQFIIASDLHRLSYRYSIEDNKGAFQPKANGIETDGAVEATARHSDGSKFETKKSTISMHIPTDRDTDSKFTIELVTHPDPNLMPTWFKETEGATNYRCPKASTVDVRAPEDTAIVFMIALQSDVEFKKIHFVNERCAILGPDVKLKVQDNRFENQCRDAVVSGFVDAGSGNLSLVFREDGRSETE